MMVWVLKDKNTNQYMKCLTYGSVVLTDNINEARLFRRQCDAGNSIAYHNNPWGWRSGKQKFSFEKVAVELQLSIAEEE